MGAKSSGTKATKAGTAKAAKPTAAEQVAKVGQGLGAIVWWDLGETRVTPPVLRAALVAGGVAVAVPDIDPAGAAKRAAREYREGRGHSDRFRAEVVAESATAVQVGVLRHVRVASDEVAWKQVDRVEYDVATGTWSTGTTPESQRYITQAVDVQAHYDHAWIRPHVIQAEFARAAAFPLRRQGGIYFVPRATLPIVEALQKAVAGIGSCAILISGVTDDAQSRGAIGGAARESLTDGLGELKATIASWREAARTVRQDSADGALAAFADLKARADLYADALGLALSEFVGEVDAAKADALALVGELAAAPKPERTPRAPRDPNATTTGSTKHAAAIKALYDAHADADGVVVVAVDTIATAGLPSSAALYAAFWSRSGAGGASANAVGLSAATSFVGGKMSAVTLRPLAQSTSSSAEAPQVVDAQADAEGIVRVALEPPPVDGDPVVVQTATSAPEYTIPEPEADALADRREELASKTTSELEHTYRRATRKQPPAHAGRGHKARLIDAILAAEVARVGAK